MKIDWEIFLAFLLALLVMKVLEKFVLPKVGFYENDDESNLEEV